MVEEIKHNSETLAIIIRSNFNSEGIHFFTPDNFSQQIAFMKHGSGKNIDAHVHNKVHRDVYYTNEVLFIRKGKLRVDFYDNNKKYLESRVLNEGDFILLVAGGHGFKVLDAIEMIEIKQGPYAGEQDKIRFESVKDNDVVIK